MAIARTQAVSANASSVAITSTSANDVIIVQAYNNASTTIPTLPAGFNSVDTQAVGGSANACRVGWKLSAGADTSSGTWTNATNVVCHVYSGLNTTTPIGGHTPTAGSSTTLTYGALSMTVASGSSWIVGMGAAKSATAGMNGSTSLLTSRTNQTTVNGLDSGGGKTAYAGETLAFTTTSRWVTETLELLAAPIPIAATDGPDVAALATTVTTGAAVAATDTNDTAAVVAATWTTASIAATDGGDVAAVAAAVTTGAAISATDAADVAFVFSPGPMTLALYGLMGGPLMATAIEGGTLVAAAPLTATVAATDAADTATIATTVTTGAGIAATDGADTAAIVAANWTTASIASTDAGDTGAVATSVTTGGAISAADGADVAAVVAANWTTAQIASTDGADQCAVATSVTTAAGIVGADTADNAAIVAANWTNAAIAATDAPDLASITADASAPTAASIAATDAVDQANIAAAIWTTALLAAIDAGDIAAIAGPVPDTSADGGYLIRARRHKTR